MERQKCTLNVEADGLQEQQTTTGATPVSQELEIEVIFYSPNWTIENWKTVV